MSEDPVRLEAHVRGRVQGVGFRYHAWRSAQELDLSGWVANEADGTVRGIAEGSRGALETWLADLRAGPAASIVDAVDVTWTMATGTLGPFEIRSGGHRGD